jgi:hypothetical protein
LPLECQGAAESHLLGVARSINFRDLQVLAGRFDVAVSELLRARLLDIAPAVFGEKSGDLIGVQPEVRFRPGSPCLPGCTKAVRKAG